jgi:hypothetical protein
MDGTVDNAIVALIRDSSLPILKWKIEQFLTDSKIHIYTKIIVEEIQPFGKEIQDDSAPYAGHDFQNDAFIMLETNACVKCRCKKTRNCQTCFDTDRVKIKHAFDSMCVSQR